MTPVHRLLGRALGSLKFRLATIGVLLLATGIGLTASQLLLRAERETLHAARRNELDDAVQGARLLSTRLKENLQMLGNAASQLPVRALEDPAALRAYLASKPVLLGGFDAVIIVGGDGRIRQLHDAEGYRNPATDLSDRPYFRTAMDERRSTVSGLIVSRVSGGPIVVLSHPVQRPGEPAALLGASLKLRQRDLASALTDGDSDPGNLHLVVVTDGAGQIMAHPQAEYIGTPVDQEPRLAGAAQLWRRGALPVPTAGQALDTPDALVNAAAVAGSDWLVWRWRPLSNVMAPLAAGRSEAMRVSILLLLATGAGLFGLVSWQLRPLRALQDRAGRLGDGVTPPQSDWPRATGEIGDLSRVLRQVACERAELETSNTRTLQRLQSVMLAAPAGICVTREGCFELVSAQMCRLVGRPEAELLGQPAQLIYASNADYLALGPRVGAAFAAGQAFDGELQFLRGNGEHFAGRLRGMPVDFARRDGGTVWTLTDITAEVAARASLEWAAQHDPLTGLANRHAFEQRVQGLLGPGAATKPAVLLMLDLDRFKPVNDGHGHAAGDAVLQAVAAAIRGCVRGDDLVARLGGDEFAILLPNCPMDSGLRVAEDIRRAVLAARVPWAGVQLNVGASIGAAALADDLPTPAQWIAAADQACYDAKAAGRDRVATAARLRLVAGGQVAVAGAV